MFFQQQQPLRFAARCSACFGQLPPSGAGLVDQPVPTAELRGPGLQGLGRLAFGAVVHEGMSDAEAVSEVRAGRPLELLIANAGTYGPRDADDAESAAEWLDTFAVNTVAPYLLAKALLPEVKAAGGKLVVVGTRMGSLADNSSGGFLAYRSSKTALNMAWKTLALANPDLACAMLHPGWVQTRMGGQSAPVTPEQSIAGMRKVIDGLTAKGSGAFLDYEGYTVPW